MCVYYVRYNVNSIAYFEFYFGILSDWKLLSGLDYYCVSQVLSTMVKCKVVSHKTIKNETNTKHKKQTE